jgi:hypothetical protein
MKGVNPRMNALRQNGETDLLLNNVNLPAEGLEKL